VKRITQMNASIDWTQLARQLGLLRENGESSGSDAAMRALELLLGEDNLRAAVDHFVSFQPGSELVRSVLWMLHPWSAMQRCYEIYRSDAEIEQRRNAIFLLRFIADRRALSWAQEFLDDPDSSIQNCGANMVDQLLWASLVEPEDCAELLEKMARHPNTSVQETFAWIRSSLRKRQSHSE
jgi:hypothetical protein